MSEENLAEFGFNEDVSHNNEERNVSLKDDTYTKAFYSAQVNRLTEENNGLRQDREQRKVYSICLFAFTCLYMIATIVVVYLCGLGYMHLSDAILITLLTTTLAEVIGMFNFVARYLFYHK